jgi:GNAT superfamily N-acetyltransferase
VEVVPLDPFADDAALAPYCSLVAEASADRSPAGLRPTPAYVLTRLRRNAPHKRVAVLVAGELACPAGAVEVTWVEAADNRDRAWVWFGLPPGAPDEVTAALARAAAAFAAAEGRDVLMVDVPAGSPLHAWVDAHGGRRGGVEEHNVLLLRDASRADLAAFALPPEGYEAVRFEGAPPEDLLLPFTRLTAVMNDAPRDDLTQEDAVMTPERVRGWFAGVAARGHLVSTAVARHVATGELAAYNEVIHRTDWPQVVENADTGVVRAHRGHGLGLFVKAVNLLRVLDLPDVVCVETWNARSNEHMVRVNRRLGFRCEHEWVSYEVPAAALLA